ncbi:MAG TPA: response regulator [Planctomycetota bacterium]|nr:response regulator [Planctomycetota bacterium]
MSERRKVLAVEDSPTARRMLVLTLEALGYQAIEAVDGASALEAFAREAPRIVVTDWMLPDLEGPELCRHIRAASARAGGYVYLVVLTGSSDRDDVIAAIRAGADEFMMKPPHAGELEARLRTAERILDLEAAARVATLGATMVTLKHELNNPLTGIIGFAELALSEPRQGVPPGIIEALESIRKLGREVAAKLARVDELKAVKLTDYLPGRKMLDMR